MSVKHIDFIKIKPSKLLAVEIRPIRSLLDTPAGVTKTAKWMTYEHWKELRLLLNDIADQYKKDKKLMSVTKPIKCNELKIKDGKSIKIGYMFVPSFSCSCHSLTPRDNETWTDDEDEENDHQVLRDEDGWCKSLTPCGEMLVVSVRLQDDRYQALALSNVLMSPAEADKQLLKALDSSFSMKTKISDYFPSRKDSQNSESLFSSSEKSSTDQQKTLKTMAEKSQLRHKRKKVEDTRYGSVVTRSKITKKSIFATSSDSYSITGSESEDETPFNRLINRNIDLCSTPTYPVASKTKSHLANKCLNSEVVKEETSTTFYEKKKISEGKEDCIEGIDIKEEIKVKQELEFPSPGWMEENYFESNHSEFHSTYDESQHMDLDDSLPSLSDMITSKKQSSNNLTHVRDNLTNHIANRTDLLDRVKDKAFEDDSRISPKISYSPVKEEDLELKSYDQINLERSPSLDNLNEHCLTEERNDVMAEPLGFNMEQYKLEPMEFEDRLHSDDKEESVGSPDQGTKPPDISDALNIHTRSPSPQVASGVSIKTKVEDTDLEFSQDQAAQIDHGWKQTLNRDDDINNSEIPIKIPLKLLSSPNKYHRVRKGKKIKKSENVYIPKIKKQMLFGEDEESNVLEETEDSNVKEMSKSIFSDEEYVPVPKSSVSSGSEEALESQATPYFEYNPSPITKNVRCSNTESSSDAQTNVGSLNSDASSKNESITYRRSKRHLYKKPNPLLSDDEFTSGRVGEIVKKDIGSMKKNVLKETQCNTNKTSASCNSSKDQKKKPKTKCDKSKNKSSDTMNQKKKPKTKCDKSKNKSSDKVQSKLKMCGKTKKKVPHGSLKEFDIFKSIDTSKETKVDKKCVKHDKGKTQSSESDSFGRVLPGPSEISEKERADQTRKGRAFLRKVEKELRDVRRKIAMEDSQFFNDSTEKVDVAPSKSSTVKRKPGLKRKIKRLSNQPTIQQCFMLKSLSSPLAKKKCTRYEPKPPSNHSVPSLFQRPKRTKRISKDLFEDSDNLSDSSLGLGDESELPNLSQGDEIQLPSLSKGDESELPRLSQLDESELPCLSKGEESERVRDPYDNGMSIRDIINEKLPWDSDDSIDLPPLEPLPPSFFLSKESDNWQNGTSDSVVITESSTLIDHLTECRTKLRQVSLEDLAKRLESEDTHIRAIINENIPDERHQIYKKGGPDYHSLFSTTVYGTYLDEQIEFLLPKMMTKYEALKDSVYVMRVLCPSFFVKLAKEILELNTNSEVEDILYKICSKLDDPDELGLAF